MFLARIAFFRLHESPRYLVHAGRPQEAVEALQMISKFNGSEIEIELDDVADYHPFDTQRRHSQSSLPSQQCASIPSPTSTTALNSLTTNSTTTSMNIQRTMNESTIFDAGDIEGAGSRSESRSESPTNKTSAERAPLVTQYDSIGQTPIKVLEGHLFKTPLLDHYPPPPQVSLTSSSETVTSSRGDNVNKEEDRGEEGEQKKLDVDNAIARPRQSISFTTSSTRREIFSTLSRNSSIFEVERTCRLLPRSVRKPLVLWWDRVSMVLEPEWFRTTVLVWGAWFFMSLGMSYPFVRCSRPHTGADIVFDSIHDV